MDDLVPFLKSLLSTSGISGYEAPVLKIIEERWRPLVDELSISRVGSLHGLKRGIGREKRPVILIAAHMDAIGLMVSSIVEGFLHVTNVGSVDARVLPGTPVIVHGRQDLHGIVVLPPQNLLPDIVDHGALGLEYLLVDTGLTQRQVSQQVKVGDLVSFNTHAFETSGGIISGHSLDNRASVAAITVCLDELKTKPQTWDVWVAATVQEEIDYGGAATSSFQLKPDVAIAVDTTFGKAPGSDGWETFELGKGPTLGIGPNIHPFLHTHFKKLAEDAGIPSAVEPMPASSGTDGMAMQVSAAGVPTMVISIPIRYMHTPVEVAALKDIQRAGRLLAGFIEGLEQDYLEKITWDT